MLGGCGRRAQRHRFGASGAVPAAGAASSGTKRPLVPAGSRGGWAQHATLPLTRASARHRRDPGMGHPPPPGPPTRGPLTILVTEGLQEKGQAESARLPGDMSPHPATPSRCWEPQPQLPLWGPSYSTR